MVRCANRSVCLRVPFVILSYCIQHFMQASLCERFCADAKLPAHRRYDVLEETFKAKNDSILYRNDFALHRDCFQIVYGPSEADISLCEQCRPLKQLLFDAQKRLPASCARGHPNDVSLDEVIILYSESLSCLRNMRKKIQLREYRKELELYFPENDHVFVFAGVCSATKTLTESDIGTKIFKDLRDEGVVANMYIDDALQNRCGIEQGRPRTTQVNTDLNKFGP